FGALTFSVLAWSYWRERRRRPGGGSVLPAFTVVCAAAFLINIVRQIAAALGVDSALVTRLTLTLGMITCLVPPVLVHWFSEGDKRCRRALVTFYALRGIAAVVRGLEAAELISSGWAEQSDSLPAVMLGAAGALGLVAQKLARPVSTPVDRQHAVWN